MAGVDAAKGGIVVDGLADLRAALGAMDESLTDIIRVANGKAADLVAEGARGTAAGIGAQAAKAADTLRRGTQSTAATLRLGGSGFRGALGAEFGAHHNVMRAVVRGGKGYQVRGWNQFPSWRGSGEGAGYFLWPTIRRDAGQILDAYTHELDRLLSRYFPVHGPALPG